ncbi:MAG: type III-B CRISPR module-associated protein Cmr3 [Desulfacinum sp.]|jgi:CRISPR-associated protein Cmr3|nr:type III-B CRISPR module-associated protein Cmr3 [Desulfacinum sp.]MBZ4659588.1 CRISPR-associated protein Cmr3 family [Desulfacinum sp.]
MTALSITPVDVLMLRGNRLFGGGVHGEAQMPPWPSVVTGAVLSRALADLNKVQEIACYPDRADRIVAESLGEDFGLRSLWVMKGGEMWGPAPADLVVSGGPEEGVSLHRIEPREISSGPISSYPLDMLPVLDARERRKPAASVWLKLEGWKRHLDGQQPSSSCVTTADQLWAVDPRLGIALESCARTAKTGAIYTTDAVAMKGGTCLVAVFRGRQIPKDGLLRLGGDGRGAEIAPAGDNVIQTLQDFGRPGRGWKGFRMILATPGIFPSGWLPPGVDPSAGYTFSLDGLKAKLVSATVTRHQVISGWDLANQQPKPAQKAVPAGACYWFRVEDGDTEALRKLYDEGLWVLLNQNHGDGGRRREGWNQVWFGKWT